MREADPFALNWAHTQAYGPGTLELGLPSALRANAGRDWPRAKAAFSSAKVLNCWLSGTVPRTLSSQFQAPSGKDGTLEEGEGSVFSLT